MPIVDSVSALRAHVRSWRQHGARVAFVPTMGNLHQGHLSLVGKAREHADKVVVSIFVNPLQFDDKQDLSRYPRTLEHDIGLLSELDCDLVFTPSETVMYPQGIDSQTQVHVPGVGDKLCGLSRPGHFDGVATVVTKLFNMVQADIAIFGEKDYQQLLLIKKLVQDLNLPVEVLGMPTCREDSGLAMSSRNQHLSTAQRTQAAQLYRALCQVAAAIEAGEHDYAVLCRQAESQLRDAGLEPDYMEVRRAQDLEPAVPGHDTALRILAAARLDQTRLIDNVPCNLA